MQLMNRNDLVVSPGAHPLRKGALVVKTNAHSVGLISINEEDECALIRTSEHSVGLISIN